MTEENLLKLLNSGILNAIPRFLYSNGTVIFVNLREKRDESVYLSILRENRYESVV